MTLPPAIREPEVDPDQIIETRDYVFSLNRRTFVQVLGSGLMIAVGPAAALAQARQGGGGGRDAAQTIAARIHLADDGTVTVLTGKIEAGQGSRAELSQAAAEELRLPVAQVRVVLGDTDRVPNDGLTAGSRTTPSTVPAVRQGAAAARQLLVELAAGRWGVEPATLEVGEGRIHHPPTGRALTYAELAQDDGTAEAFKRAIPPDLAVTDVQAWRVLGQSVSRPNARDLVTGGHRFPSDLTRPGMLYGKVLRPPSYGAKLVSVDLAPAQSMPATVVVRDGEFVGVAAPTTARAEQALDVLAKTAKWEPAAHPSSKELFNHLRRHAQGGIPDNPFTEERAQAKTVLRQTYRVPYVQHAPMETRTALAEWQDGRLTVWSGTQNPFGYRSELARAFRLAEDRVRLVVPDFGGGFGGKHTGEAAVEAARLSQAAGRPVLLQWTREEEFTWASFRPAALMDAEASLDDKGGITSWYFINVNAGGSAIDTPYRVGQRLTRSINSQAPLRHGSYRALASTANNFARECFMDELAAAAGADPLTFRLAHLDHERLRPVLEEAARRFQWKDRIREKKNPHAGFGLACGTEKGSYVAACAEVVVDPPENRITVRSVCEVFECGAILNPDNLMAQVQGAMIMGLGPALREEMQFELGVMGNARFSRYAVPRFRDVPELDIHLLNRPDLPSAGGGETPIIAIAPAIANAVFQATGRPIHEMPIRMDSGQA